MGADQDGAAAQAAAVSQEELLVQIAEKGELLRQARLKHALKQLQKTHTLKSLRRDIARLKGALGAHAVGTKEGA